MRLKRPKATGNPLIDLQRFNEYDRAERQLLHVKACQKIGLRAMRDRHKREAKDLDEWLWKMRKAFAMLFSLCILTGMIVFEILTS